MKDKFFNTKKKREAALVNFSGLLTHPGWKLFEQITNANIEVVTDLILTGKNLDGKAANEDEMDRLRDKLQVYKDQMNTPKKMIKSFESSESEEPNLDPFQTRKQLEEERKKRT